MSAADALTTLLEAAAAAGARTALAEFVTAQPSRWLPVKQSPLGYRATLDLIRAGEIHVHGIGHRRYVDREAVNAWLLAHPIAVASKPLGEPDEIDVLVASNRARKARRKGAEK